MKVVEIFDSIDGEGIRTGMTATFIRLAGCNLRCTYCDTLYALFNEAEKCKYTEMSVDEILEKVNPKFRRVTLTGGEPLIHKDVEKLLLKLSESGIETNIETNGAVDLSPFQGKYDNLFFTVDYKLSSSGEEDKMIWENFLNLSENDVIKFVVGSKDDVTEMKEIMRKLNAHYKKLPHIFAGAVYKSYDTEELVNDILSDDCLKDVRVQLQIHKIIWDPDRRGV